MANLLNQYKLSQGIYIHIPHCLQKCHYCDFPTVLLDKSPDLDAYTQLITKELDLKLLNDKNLSSIYFGGGTPSLLGAKRIESILNHILSIGYQLEPNCEITVEINPGTLSKTEIHDLKMSGVNRFSLGVQTFNDSTLKLIGREHSSQDSLITLDLLNKADVAFTADLILALPGQTFSSFTFDAKKLFEFNPHHLSVYVLTVPENNFLSKNMPKDDLLDELMDHSEDFLFQHGYKRYEISNYMKTNGKPSLHNLLYWNDLSYWGVGLGAHSYFQNMGLWGTRFWNPRTLRTYQAQLEDRIKNLGLPPKAQTEELQLNESLTDFCFTHLRQWSGIDELKLSQKYPKKISSIVLENLQNLQKDGYIVQDQKQWRLSKKGRKFADHVFRCLCFTKEDVLKELL